MARYLYTFIYYLIFPLVLLRLWWRGKKAPQYRLRWLERLGIFSSPSDTPPTLWIHSVSVGETIAAAPLIKSLQARYPQVRLVVTTMTPTGSERVRSLFGDTVFHVYAPYDLPGCIKRFYQRLRPMALIVMETELWPNWVHFCKRRNIPTILANGRLSERSARGYEKVRWLSGSMFEEISWVAAQNSQDAARFARLGVKDKSLTVTGSIKFDIQITDDIRRAGKQFRQQWGEMRPVVMAGSTHEGEESLLLEAFQKIRTRYPEALLIIVPRHPERFESVAGLIDQAGLTMSRRSLNVPFSPEVQVVLGDTMGEQMKFYAAADVAFVGGSLIERGGHNPLEPAALGLPVLMGPHVFNFQDICTRLETEGALVTVSQTSLQEEIESLLKSEQLRQERGGKARQFVESNQGALERLVSGISQRIDPNGRY
ncbi:3-deoxy-D-manno-octulosonic acid transferase [Hahella sp. CCB-MM4]|uniref:lipid IV(A) 3-deoxy-D-manno-octulosonic acid transferase n=1 Tax=Hahella sp. (strain CCB-MM4) TaxID=1926491 RepID=UPI000B9B5B18|nr:lipid IV(A) 3-deoxy-D-manno-octulosonic acid transferase [Hahella sp. CCB-MM4]OZG71413.1 3-deoxy-D-manno-octulosonic acid transferase [Hahella sp. CCB-MM4]